MYPDQVKAFEQEYSHLILRFRTKEERRERAMRIIEKRYSGDEKNTIVAKLNKLQESEQ